MKGMLNMVINVFNESNHTDENSIKSKGEEDSEVKKIKSLLEISNLKYVSDNIKYLLNLNIMNNTECFLHKNNAIIKDAYRVILYIRLSVEDGDLIDGDVSRSIKNQLLLLLDECKQRGWVIVAIFCEEGISGTDDNRPEWKKSLKFCENGNTEIVLCKSQSRFSRSMEMIEKYLHNEFVTWNIRFVGLVDSTDTSIIGNKKTRQINGLVNEWYVEDQSMNIRAIFKNKQSNGLFLGSFGPYGYKKDPKDKYHLIIDAEAANIVRKIFNMYAGGQGASKICRYLNENKIPTPTEYKHRKGSKYNCPKFEFDKRITYKVEREDTLVSIADRFHSTVQEIMKYNSLNSEHICEGDIIIIPVLHVWKTHMIYRILNDSVYIGTLTQHKKETISYKNKKLRNVLKENQIVIPHCHMPIIDMETWKIVNSRIGQGRKVKSSQNGEIHLFSGKLKCGSCGHTFGRDTNKYKEKVYVYWHCLLRGNTAKFLCNNRISIREEDLYQIVLKEINNQLKRYYDKNLIKENYDKQKTSISLQDEINILENEKREIQNSIRKKENLIALLYEDKINGTLSLEEFTLIKNRNNIEIRNYKERLKQIETTFNQLNSKKKDKINAENILEKYTKIDKLDKHILDEFISKIYIYPYDSEKKQRKIKIEWNFES